MFVPGPLRRCVSRHSATPGLSDFACFDILTPKASQTMCFSTFWDPRPLRFRGPLRRHVSRHSGAQGLSRHCGAQGLSSATFLDILGAKPFQTQCFSTFWRGGLLRRCASRHSGALGLSDARLSTFWRPDVAFLHILAPKASQTLRFLTFWRKVVKTRRKHGGNSLAIHHHASKPRL